MIINLITKALFIIKFQITRYLKSNKNKTSVINQKTYNLFDQINQQNYLIQEIILG